MNFAGIQPTLKRRPWTKASMVVLCLLAGLLAVQPAWSARKQAPRPPMARSVEAALAEARETGKPVVLIFTAVWCPICDAFKKQDLTDGRVTALGDDFLWAMVDIDRDLSVARRWQVKSVPTILLLDAAGGIRHVLEGRQPAVVFEVHLQRFLAELDPNRVPDDVGPAPEEGDAPRSQIIWQPKGYRSFASCFSHVGYGPLSLPSQSPLQALRLGLRPRAPSTLGKGQKEVRVSTTWANIWAVDKPDDRARSEFFLDFETLQTRFGMVYGLTDHLQIEGNYSIRNRFGGAMDNLIQQFHDLVGIGQAGRDDVPRNDFTFDINPPDGRNRVSLDSGDKGTFSSSLDLTLQHNVTCGTAARPAFSYALTARVETESQSVGAGSSLDLGGSVALSRRVKSTYFYGMAGYSVFGDDNFEGLTLEDTQFTIMLAFEWQFLPRQALLLQYLVSEGQLDNVGEFSGVSNEITLGWKGEIPKFGVLEVGLLQNAFSFDNSADFGIHLGFSRRF